MKDKTYRHDTFYCTISRGFNIFGLFKIHINFKESFNDQLRKIRQEIKHFGHINIYHTINMCFTEHSRDVSKT